MMTKPRKYQQIWERIKDKSACSIQVHPKLAARVKKGVIKEKSNDLGFKVLNDNDYCFLKISYDKEKQVMKFKLKQRIGIEEVKK